MNKNNSSIILSNCLIYCVSNKKHTFPINDFKNDIHLKCYNTNEIYSVIKKANCLFVIEYDIVKGIMIKTKITLKTCDDYNNLNRSCKLGNLNECKLLHLCNNELKNIDGCNMKDCKLNHKFDTYFIKNVLDNFELNVAPNILLEFYKVKQIFSFY
jgi:hypothetical protein